MTIHHDIALALSCLLVLAGLMGVVFGHPSPDFKDTLKDVIGFATTIAVATFAHAQGVKAGIARSNGNSGSDAKQ